MGAVFGRGIFFEVRRSCVWTVIAEGLRDNRSLFVHETVQTVVPWRWLFYRTDGVMFDRMASGLIDGMM